MPKSKIDWTDYTWNPVSGCTKVSEGCKFCYAEKFSRRTLKPFDQPSRKFTDIVFHEEKFNNKLNTYPEGSKIFVGSVTDIFHPDIPDSFLDRLWNVFLAHSGCDLVKKLKLKKLTFQILTKRPERMMEYCNKMQPLPNVWLGVSAENQQRYYERIPFLLRTRAAIRFVSLEPLLGEINIKQQLVKHWAVDKMYFVDGKQTSLDWVIVGGESGPIARECDIEWILDIANQCKLTGVPLFVKQLGSRPIYEFPKDFNKVRHILIDKSGIGYKGNNFENFPDQLQFREFPNVKS